MHLFHNYDSVVVFFCSFVLLLSYCSCTLLFLVVGHNWYRILTIQKPPLLLLALWFLCGSLQNQNIPKEFLFDLIFSSHGTDAPYMYESEYWEYPGTTLRVLNLWDYFSADIRLVILSRCNHSIVSMYFHLQILTVFNW